VQPIAPAARGTEEPSYLVSEIDGNELPFITGVPRPLDEILRTLP
jgi:hypothetical protein